MQAVDFLILLLAGACLGALAKVNDESLGAQGYTYTVIAVCKLLFSSLFFVYFKILSNLICACQSSRSLTELSII